MGGGAADQNVRTAIKLHSLVYGRGAGIRAKLGDSPDSEWIEYTGVYGK